MTSFDDPAAFAALATELHAEPDETRAAELIVTRLTGVLPGADHLSLTVRPNRQSRQARPDQPRELKLLASSDEVAESATALQLGDVEGPVSDRFEEQLWVRSGEVGRDARWPTWGPQAAGLGIGSVLGVQLLDRGRPGGVLTIYADDVGRFGERSAVDLALVVAEHASTALASARLATNLRAALGSRHVIGMAQGIVMEKFDVTERQSFDLLRRLSSAGQHKLRDVAAHIVDTRTLPEIPAEWREPR